MIRTMKIGILANFPLPQDWLWAQCPESAGRCGEIQLVANAAPYRCDGLLVVNSPVRLARPGPLTKLARNLRDPAVPRLDLPADRIVMTTREPPDLAPQWWFTHARLYADRVIGHDPRSTERVVMPARWHIHGDYRWLKGLEPQEKTVNLACVTSGASALPGHRARLAFLRRILDSGLQITVAGRGLPGWVRTRGPIVDKGQLMRIARYTLVTENDLKTPLYVSEKLWEPLLCWSLPLYMGGPAADTAIPQGSFIRLPGYDDQGLELVRQTISTEQAYLDALPAIAEARKIILDELNMARWAERVFGECGHND